MKIKLLAALIMSLVSTSVFAAEPKVDAKMAEMMKKFKEYSTPGAAHKTLADMAGNWTYASKMWETPDGKAQESKGTSSMKMILGGRFLQHDIKGEAMGMPFEGLGFTGYDNIKKKYDTLWLDNMATGVMHGTGSFDATSKTLKDSGQFSCPMSPNKTRDYRGEWKITDKNNMTYSMFGPGPDGGKEYKQMEMVFKRVK